MRKVRTGSLTPVYETYVLKAIGIVIAEAACAITGGTHDETSPVARG